MSPSTRQAVAPSHWVGNGFPNHAIVPGWWRKGVRLIDLVLPQDIPRHQGRNCRFGVGELSRLEPTVRPHAATALQVTAPDTLGTYQGNPTPSHVAERKFGQALPHQRALLPTDARPASSPHRTRRPTTQVAINRVHA